MAKINDLTDFNNITGNITSFSHAYLFNTNSLTLSYRYVKEFAKRIICENVDKSEYEDICYQIDHNEYEDFYVVNPNTISINAIEIEKLMNYMETKSLKENGRRVYIIYGFERLLETTSNKILKFLEEPSDNLYGLLITENIDKILPTIISRCQVFNLTFDIQESSNDLIGKMNGFFKCILEKKYDAIAYTFFYFDKALADRNLFHSYFECLEKIFSNIINKKCGVNYKEEYVSDSILKYNLDVIIKFLNITNNLKSLILQNINLNLLLDRYIIEVSRELISCKK